VKQLEKRAQELVDLCEANDVDVPVEDVD